MIQEIQQIAGIFPAAVVVTLYIFQTRFFVTPEQLEKKHREILDDSSRRFATQQAVCDLKEQFSEIREKIDEIYRCVMKR